MSPSDTDPDNATLPPEPIAGWLGEGLAALGDKGRARSAGNPALAREAPGMPTVPGYEILCELGRGGMGAVFQARDPELNRVLAVKLLLEAHRGKEELERRFREEAQITGQLQHPGVPPVHEVGRSQDGRPYLAMKLIQGRTLGELLQERPTPASELPRFLSIFELVCQTLAYAHSRGVIHRDLKPANIMVGAFGEVQVMDWGLAKVRGGPSSGAASIPQAVTTERTDLPWLMSQAGAVLGTPAFMAPEQARGEVEQLDERCDVFGLGAILTVILTGAPPYANADTAALVQQAAQGDLAGAHARLDACGADPELVKLARGCLAARVQERLQDAGAVAEALAAYLGGVREKLRQAELERAAANLRVVEERKRRRLTAVLAAVAIAAVVLAVVGWRFIEQTREAYQSQTAVQVNQELGRANSLRDQARSIVLGDAATREASARLWAEALAAAGKAEAILATAPADDDTRQLVESTTAGLQSEAGEVARDRAMLERLEAARDLRTLVTDEDVDRMNPRSFIVYGHAPGDAYAAAFRDYGIDVAALPPAEAAARIRRQAIRVQLASALDDWLILAVDHNLARKLVEVARAGDDDAFRTRLRVAAVSLDGPELLKLAAESATLELTVPIAVLLADGLHLAGEDRASVEVLERARKRYPDDFWINDILGVYMFYADPSRVEEAGRCFAAALARRSHCYFIHSNLGTILEWQCRWPEAIQAYERAIAMNKDFLRGRVELAGVAAQQGDLDRAVALCEEVLRLRPGDSLGSAALARFRLDQGRKDEALKLARDLVARAPKLSAAHACLGDVLLQVDPVKAASSYREALQRNPFLIGAQTGLAYALINQNRFAEAREALAPALKRGAKVATVHVADSFWWSRQGKWHEAIAAMRRAVELRPAHFLNHVSLGDLLMRAQALDEAALAYRQAAQLNPTAERAHNGLGLCLEAKQEWQRACTAFEKAIELRPKWAEFRLNLGNVLLRMGAADKALREFQKAEAIEPSHPEAPAKIGIALTRLQRPAEAVPPLLRACELAPANTVYRNALGLALQGKGDIQAAIAAFQQAARQQDGNALYWRNLGNAYRARQQLAEAVKAHRRACILEPDRADHHADLGSDLRLQGADAEALSELRRAIEIRPDYAWAHNELGLTLQQAGTPAEALSSFRQAILNAPEIAILHDNLGRALRSLGRVDEAVKSFQRAVELDERLESARLNLGRALFEQGQFRQAHRTMAVSAARMLASKKSVDGATKQLIERCKRLGVLEAKREEIVIGKLAPAAPAERLDFAVFCAHSGHPGAAVAHFLSEFEKPSATAEQPGLHFTAALAALAAVATAADDQVPRYRRNALVWLRAELDIVRKQAAGKAHAERLTARGTLLAWRQHRQLAGVSDAAALANLPEVERSQWRSFWTDVTATADGLTPPPKDTAKSS